MLVNFFGDLHHASPDATGSRQDVGGSRPFQVLHLIRMCCTGLECGAGLGIDQIQDPLVGNDAVHSYSLTTRIVS